MPHNPLSGPQIGIIVAYTQNPTLVYPALITGINNNNGLIELTTFPPGLGSVDQQNVRSDENSIASGTWRFLKDIEQPLGVGVTPPPPANNLALREDGSMELREDGSFALRE